MTAPLVTREDLESFFTPKLVTATFSDDGRNPGPRLTQAILAGSGEAAGILGKVSVWRDDESLSKLIAEDHSVKHCICKLIMAIGAESKPEWYNRDGPAAGWRREARQVLDDIAQRKIRSPGENVTGANTVVFPRVANARQFEFARRRNRDSSGGGF